MVNKIYKILFILILSLIITLFVGTKKSYAAATVIANWEADVIDIDFTEEEKEKFLSNVLEKLRTKLGYTGEEVQTQMKMQTKISVIKKGAFKYTIQIRKWNKKNKSLRKKTKRRIWVHIKKHKRRIIMGRIFNCKCKNYR